MEIRQEKMEQIVKGMSREDTRGLIERNTVEK